MNRDKPTKTDWFWLVVAVLLALAVLLFTAGAFAQIPRDASLHKRDLIRNARMVWGLSAPVATFAAQIHQESGWDPAAVSPVGAAGMAQFMPGTSLWISGLYSDLDDNQPYNPQWALRALVQYDKWLYDRVPAALTHCEQMAFVLSSYNGGLGWLQKDVRKCMVDTKNCDAVLWFNNVEMYNGGRAIWAFRENRGYSSRILQGLEARYQRAGWGIASC